MSELRLKTAATTQHSRHKRTPAGARGSSQSEGNDSFGSPLLGLALEANLLVVLRDFPARVITRPPFADNRFLDTPLIFAMG
jgi:hypothetical protein